MKRTWGFLAAAGAVAMLAGCFTVHHSPYPDVRMSSLPEGRRMAVQLTGFAATLTTYVPVYGYETVYGYNRGWWHHGRKCSYSEILHQKIEKIHKKFMGLPHRFLNKELTRFFPGLRHTSGFVRLLWTSTVVNRVCTPYPLLPLEGSQPTSSSVTWSPAQSASSGLTTTISISSPRRKPANKASLPNSRTEIYSVGTCIQLYCASRPVFRCPARPSIQNRSG